MKRIAPFFFFLAASLSAAQSAPLITNVPNRTTISLNGAWRTIVDPYDVGRNSRFFLNAKPKDARDLVEYDFDTSPQLNVPGDWNSQRDDLLFYEGTVWYKRSFTYHKREHTRVFVYFGAAAMRATVYLNGAKLGSHEGGYTPFDFEVTDALHDGPNFLVVEVNNRRRPDAVPSLATDWWNYGGLTRDVLLVEVRSVFIEDYFVQLAKGSSDEVAGWVRIDGTRQPQNVTIEIPDAGIRHSLSTDASGFAEFRFPAHIQLWSPNNPKLYRVVLSASEDTVHDDIGFRRIETRGTKIVLNGEPIFLRGISMHEEAPFRGGRAFSPEDDVTLLGWAKELGCNFVRLVHYPHNEGMTRLADRLGLMLWSEVPVYWDNDWTNPAALKNAQQQLRENIARDHNRASVILWSIANETPVAAPRTEFLHKLADEVRQLDATRLVTAATDKSERTFPTQRTVNDPLGQFLDVIGVNEYLGWYEGPPEAMDQMQWTTIYDKPIIISEFGAGAPYGNHGDANTRWTEEYQVNVFQHQLAMLRHFPAVAGMSPWLLMDFRSPRRLLPGVQDYHNRKGLISDRGERKQAFYVLQKFYRELDK
ncbi:MAG TPA: glycoside hydrolase family 2 TIM barrel-domain containing protein [Dongiaceae bacterium]|nr:glycoside hydrolase family 2 TIM barrel-domain containing protein [Dongiaceae bacterium]